MKAYYQLTREEKIKLSSDELVDAVKLEAINRNIKPPVTLSDALKATEWVGYQVPAKSMPVYTIRIGYHGSSFGYLDKELATKALDGMVLFEQGYGTNGAKIKTEEPTIEVKWVGASPAYSKAAAFEDYFQDDTEFNKLRDECVEELRKIHQEEYDTKVRKERRAEYLRLANGNEEIAMAFWSKAERTEWPSA